MIQILEEIKLKAQTLGIWDTNFTDRLEVTCKRKQESMIIAPSAEVDTWGEIPSDINLILRDKHEARMPYYPLPNAGSYHDKPEDWNFLSSLFDIYTRIARSASTRVGWFNGKANKHMLYRFRYLGYLRDKLKYGKYWSQAFRLLKHPVFQQMAYNKVNGDWYKNSSQTRVEKDLKILSNLCESEIFKIDFKRVYIPKGVDSHRPLGVPSMPWRAYLHMINVLIVWYVIGDRHSQHAYTPGKGTHTVWKEIFKKLDKESNIYEFDLSKFFDKVNLDYNKGELASRHFPTNVQEFLLKMNQSIVTLTSEDLLDESDNRKIILNSDNSLNPNLPASVKKELGNLDLEDIKKAALTQTLLSEGYSLHKKVGVPQGAATSCSLSILNLTHLFTKFPGIVMYADDGLVFPKSCTIEPNLDNPEAGIYQNQSKSGWIKKDGKWLKALKFCGLKYIPAHVADSQSEEITAYPRLMASTRNGSNLEFSQREQLLCYLNERYHEDLKLYKLEELENSSTVGEWIIQCVNEFESMSIEKRLGLLFKSKLGPMMLASLYNNSWQLNEISDKRLTFTKNSWISKGFANYLYNLFASSRAAEFLENKAHAIDMELVSLKERTENFIKLGINPKLFNEDLKEMKKLTRTAADLEVCREFMVLNVTPSSRATLTEEGVKDLDGIMKFDLSDEEQVLKSSAFDSLFKFKKNCDKRLNKITLNKQTKSKYLEYRNCWKQVLKHFKLDLSNVSSFATHNMLEGLDYSANKIKYCIVLSQISMNPKKAKELFNTSKSSKLRKALRKRRLENNRSLLV